MLKRIDNPLMCSACGDDIDKDENSGICYGCRVEAETELFSNDDDD